MDDENEELVSHMPNVAGLVIVKDLKTELSSVIILLGSHVNKYDLLKCLLYSQF